MKFTILAQSVGGLNIKRLLIHVAICLSIATKLFKVRSYAVPRGQGAVSFACTGCLASAVDWPQGYRVVRVTFRHGGSNHWNKLRTSLYTSSKKRKKNPVPQPNLLSQLCCFSFFSLSGLPGGLLLIAWCLSMLCFLDLLIS